MMKIRVIELKNNETSDMMVLKIENKHITCFDSHGAVTAEFDKISQAMDFVHRHGYKSHRQYQYEVQDD